MKEGDIVRLKSEDTEMVIEKTETVGHVNSPITICHCVWFDSINHLQKGKFRSTSLEKVED